MLNEWLGMGRIIAPIELKKTPSGDSVITFSIACERDYRGQNGERETDFFNVVAWKQTAEMISKFFTKGSLICIKGRLQQRTYTGKDEKKHTIIEIVADRAYFTGERKETATGENMSAPEGFETVPDDDSDLPF